jgi:hypothetical protein
MRMGVHSGEVIGSVVGSKMPHFSVFGDTVPQTRGLASKALRVLLHKAQWAEIVFSGRNIQKNLYVTNYRMILIFKAFKILYFLMFSVDALMLT